MSASLGYIYAMVSGSLPGQVKIGCTTKDPQERARELSAGSGVPTPFVLAYSRYIRDPFKVEATLHRFLHACRVNDSREFFKIELHKVIELMERYEEIAKSEASYLYPWATLFSTFDHSDDGRELTEDEAARCADLRAKMAAQ